MTIDMKADCVTEYIYTYSDKQTIFNKIYELTEIQQNEIYNIINLQGIHHTHNSNGVFINFSAISNNVLKEIDDYIKYIKNNDKTLQNIEDLYINIGIESYDNEMKVQKDTMKNIQEFSKLPRDYILELIRIRSEMNKNRQRKSESHLRFTNSLKKFSRIIYNNNPNPDGLINVVENE
jgi:hypothetical protein